MAEDNDIDDFIRRFLAGCTGEDMTLDEGLAYLRERNYPEDVIEATLRELRPAAPKVAILPPGREIRFTPSAERYARWQASAEAVGFPLTIWVQLAADGVLSMKKPETVTPVHSSVHEPSLWSRIHAIVGNMPITSRPHATRGGPTVWTVRALAKKLAVSEKSVYAALHSRMASKRMVRVGDEYLTKGEN